MLFRVFLTMSVAAALAGQAGAVVPPKPVPGLKPQLVLPPAKVKPIPTPPKVTNGVKPPIADLTKTPAQPELQIPVTIHTGAITLTGTGSGPQTDFGPFTPVNIRTGALTLTGTGSGPQTDFGPFTPVNIRTGALTLTGTGGH